MYVILQPCDYFLVFVLLVTDILNLLDYVSQICDVVLVRRTFSSGKPQGVGILEWGGDGNGEISLQATWDQGGRDPITARRVPSK
jgi:hypothetical protein